MKKAKRLCWWCNKRLMEVSHAVISNGTKTHKCCAPDAENYLRKITAQKSDRPPPVNGEDRDDLLEAHNLSPRSRNQ